MTIALALDTSQQWCSVAVSQDGSVLAHNSEPMPSGGSDILLPRIITTLNKASLTLKDIDLITTITGPGSFTGLRVCIATANGIGLALSKPVIGIDTFNAYALCIKTDKNILVAIDSQKQDVYCQLFSPKLKPLKEAVAISPDQIEQYAGNEPFIITGTGIYKTQINCEKIEITPDDACQQISLIKYRSDQKTTMAQPFYLKEAIVQKK